jgi:predicted metal-binding membrane protein
MSFSSALQTRDVPKGARADRYAFLAIFWTLIALAWLALILWQASPYGRYVDHGEWTATGLAATLCSALPDGVVAFLPALLYAAGWLLMIAAMMLPSTLMLLRLFDRLTATRADRCVLIALVLAGYLAIWSVFGVAVHLIDLVLHRAILGSPWLAFNAWVIGAGVFVLAGGFQFSRLKYRCLEKCRTPLSFVIEHWRGRSVRAQSLLLGLHHGMFCVGCCWAVMLVSFALGTGSIVWMLAIGAVMALEKNASWGRRLSAPLGAFLLACGGAIAFVHFHPI